MLFGATACISFIYKSDALLKFVYLQAARSAGIPIILDAGGMEALILVELLSFVDMLNPNEIELGRLTGMPTDTFEQISQAVVKFHGMVSLGSRRQS